MDVLTFIAVGMITLVLGWLVFGCAGKTNCEEEVD